MKIHKAVIPMAGPVHRDLPLQHITTGEGVTRHVAALQIDELLGAGIRSVALVMAPGTEPFFEVLRAQFGDALARIEQPRPEGFGDAILCAESWVAAEPFILQVCDHVFVSQTADSCTRQLVTIAAQEECSVSAVRATPESQLPYFGVVGGLRVGNTTDLYTVSTVIEKPTPTVAEELCMVPGLRQGTYLALFGTHVLTPRIFALLRERKQMLAGRDRLGLTEGLAILAQREKYLAREVSGLRLDLEGPFGLLRAQVALALHGPRREEVLEILLEEVAHASGCRG
ncbi:MAG: UTP--glucose-1-phosphate uridylyltransferase [Deltaproteobacteria bacterium]|nr:UTP--glucose-1-phosphate uridylyltransferase [Deltaproteobacteria bacterium]